MKNRNELEKIRNQHGSKSKRTSPAVILVAVFAIIIGIALIVNLPRLMLTPSEKKDNSNNTIATEKTTTNPSNEPLTLEDKIYNLVHDNVKEKTNTDKDRISKTEIKKAANGNTRLFLYLNSDDNLSIRLTRGGMLGQSSTLFKTLFAEIKDLDEINIHWLYPMKDKYGNVEDGDILRIKLMRETAEKINWDGFEASNYPEVADFFFMHPAFYDKD